MNKKIIGIIIGIVLVIGIITLIVCIVNKNESDIDYLVLVNKQNKLPDDWESKVKLSEAKNAWNETIKVEKTALKHYWKLSDELKKEGVEIILDSAYRSVKEQQDLWKNFE